MARKRRPSVGLIILFIILLLLYFFMGTIVELASNWSGQGSFTYNYVQGNEAIISIKYDLPQKLADALDIKQATNWTAIIAGNTLTLTGGTLNPGGIVTIDYRLKEYIPGGTSVVTVTGTTTSGTEITNQANLLVPDAFLLNIVGIIYQNNIWLLILAIIVLVVTIVLFIKGEKKQEVIVQAR